MNVNLYLSKNKCIACKKSQFLQFYKSNKSVSFSINKKLIFNQNLECCYNCGLVRQEDNATYSNANLSVYYNLSFRTPLHLATIPKDDKRIQNAKKRLRFINKFRSSGTLLEIGFGDGIFLGIAAENFSCSGVDPSAGYGYLYDDLEKKGIEISRKSLERFSSNKKFNIVCSFLVLEHIKDPLTFIKLQLKQLSTDGILVVEVPDINNYVLFNSESVLTHEHVYHYCIESLSFLFAQLNLELIAYSDKNVSYGFSLIAAYRVKEKIIPKNIINGFDVLKSFQNFLKIRVQYLQNMTVAIGEIIKEAKDKKEKLAVYGTGFLFQYAIDSKAIEMQNIDFLFDDTKGKIGSNMSGKIIRSLNEIKKCNQIVVIIFSEMFFEPMKQNILETVTIDDIKIMNIHQISIGKND